MRFRGSVLVLTAVLLCAGVVANGDDTERVRLDHFKLVEVYLATPAQLEALQELDVIMMGDYAKLGAAEYIVPPYGLAELTELGISYKVIDNNVQKALDAEYARLQGRHEIAADSRDWYDDYKDYDQVYARLQYLVSLKPDLCTLVSIGQTLGGREIWMLRISGPGADKPAVLYNGTQHAREWIGTMVNVWIAEQLVTGYDNDPMIQSLVDRVEFFIVPIVNADGYEYTWDSYRLWRKTRRNNGGGCYGVDPNRNWGGDGWGGGGSSSDPCNDLYRGPTPFSEPCTQALRDTFLANPQIVATIDFHSYSQLILWPYGYTNQPCADDATFEQAGMAMQAAIQNVHGEYYEAGPIYSTIYQASGGSVDWCYDEADVFAYTIELRPDSAWGGGFELPPDQIIPTCEENFPAVLYLSEWAATPLLIDFPSGHPTRLVPDTPQDLTVHFTEIRAELDPATPTLWWRYGAGDFSASPLSQQIGSEWTATLPATPCGYTLEYYVACATTDGELIVSPGTAPDVAYEVTAAPIALLLDEPMNVNPQWTTEGQWAWGQPTGGGGQYGDPDPTSGYTGAYVYGYNLSGDYENNMPERDLTTGVIDCTGANGVTLSFYRWLGVEQPSYDHAYIRVNNGSGWQTIWQNTGEMSDGAWVMCEYDISQFADNQPAVQIRWTQGTSDVGWQYCGWNIDDVQVWAADPDGCPGLTGDMNCDGVVSAADIDPFVLALTDPDAYAAQYPDCDMLNADGNGDGSVTAADIDPFVVILTGGR
jgi:carboxypeptidase A1